MTLRDVDYETLREALHAYAGTTLDRRRASLLEARLETIARARGMTGVAPLIEGLRHGGSSGDIVEGLVNCETSFFRDAPAFTALREVILPRLIDRGAKHRRLRVLCAGCSTGQEVYSVGMTMREHFPELARWSVEITGVDVSAKRIARAATGRYSAREVERGVPKHLISKYFEPDEGELRVVAPVRAIATFRRMNLTEAWSGLAGYDLVLLRNVLIYLDDTAKASMLTRARDSMHVNGFLLLGAAETTAAAHHAFRREPGRGYPVYTRHEH